ncbi:hypothetical protein K0M31_013730 [Melipona bicolor]|uniref:DNA-directed RNA polymerase I subunit RPA43 n=1 Tax=Melipona bicolor TaxID=60889 RepID=A0AA40FH51_9HYME|nr:hypothetical protein K0M31_013730 [Melipona bicolor]
MRFRTDSGITWSSLELAGLVEDEESRVYFEKFKKHFGLHPFHLTNLNAALNEILSSNLNSYDPDLKGFLLAYRNPKLLTSLGEIFYDTCFIHVDVETEFYVFRPEVGCKLKGVVNKKGLDHIGILVHKTFNVSIPKPNDEEDWPGDKVEIGQEVKFTITVLDFNSKLPFIRGVLNSNDYLHGCKLMLKSINNKRLTSKNNICSNSSNNVSKKNVEHAGKHTFFTTDSEDTDEDIPKVNEEIEPKVSEKKKKAKKRDKKFSEINESKTKLVNVESEYEHHANNISLNGELMSNEESELSDPKSKIEKKFKIKSSPSWVNENDETFVDNSPRNYLKSENDTSEIKVEYNRSDNESILEDKSMIKKKSMKRRRDGTSKTDSKKIKVEQFDDTCEYICDDAQESPTKHYKKHKESLQLETFESEETVTKKHTKKFNISDSQVVFENVKIKKERLTSGSENSQDENYITISKTLKKDPDASTSTCDTQPESNTTKKKRKKHSKNAIIEETTTKKDTKKFNISDSQVVFENVKIKKERLTSGSENGQDENYVTISKTLKKDPDASSSTWDTQSESNTTKKKRKKHSENAIIEETTKKHTKKFNISDSQVVFENVKIKKERLTSGSENSQDENYVTISKTLKKDPDASSSTCDTQSESNTTKKKRKKHSKNAIIDTSTIKTEFDEHEFKNFSIEEENFGSNEDVTEDRFCG